MDDHAIATPEDEIEPQSTSILNRAASRVLLGAPTGSSLSQTPNRMLRSDELSQSLNEMPYFHRAGQFINKDVRRRAIDADPNQGKICLISNSQGFAVQLCRVVNRGTPTDIVSISLQRASGKADYHPSLSRFKV